MRLVGRPDALSRQYSYRCGALGGIRTHTVWVYLTEPVPSAVIRKSIARQWDTLIGVRHRLPQSAVNRGRLYQESGDRLRLGPRSAGMPAFLDIRPRHPRSPRMAGRSSTDVIDKSGLTVEKVELVEIPIIYCCWLGVSVGCRAHREPSACLAQSHRGCLLLGIQPGRRDRATIVNWSAPRRAMCVTNSND
jgi:hypothetical protein